MVSAARPDPSSPAAIAAAAFGTSRKGYDPDEVREYLRAVSAEMTRLVERERALERELAEARTAVPLSVQDLDEATITSLLGEETARVLSTAREAAAQIRAKATEGATRLLTEAQDEAARLREQSELDAARRRHEANLEAEAELERARTQGRDMVAEARDYRERVLADLAKRREAAKEQLQQLAEGRQRLARAYEMARSTAVAVMGELDSFGDDPEDLVNLGSPTGPVPVVPARAATAAPRRDTEPAAAVPAPAPPVVTPIEPSAPEPARAAEPTAAPEPVDTTAALAAVVEEPSPEPVAADLPFALEPEPVDTTATLAADVDEVAEVADAADVVDHSDDADSSHDAGPVGMPAADDDGDGAAVHDAPDEPGEDLAPVVVLFAGELPDEPAPAAAPPASEPVAAKASVDDLFARLRAARTDEVAHGVTPAPPAATAITQPVPVIAPEPEPTPVPDLDLDLDLDAAEESPFVVRDESLAPVELNLARKFKRALADEQNDVLDVLRRREPVRSIDVLLPSPDAHVAPYVQAGREELPGAARAGARTTSTDDAGRLDRRIADAAVVERLVTTLAERLTEPLRDVLASAVARAAGDNGAIAADVRAVYREWKTQRLDELAEELARAAYARGAYAAIVPGTPVRWAVDPGVAPCRDAVTNAGAGAVRAGDPFPCGEVAPPSHPECRCLLVIADR